MSRIRYVLLAAFMLLCQMGYAQKYHDAAAFDAYGNVKWILTDVGLLYFNEDGRLEKSKSTALSDYEKYQIERDAAGYVKKITTDFETLIFTYDANHKLIKKTVKGGSNYTTIYERDENSNYQTETTKVLSGRQENTAIKYYCHKAGDNWIFKEVNEGGDMKNEKRVVGYWFDQTNYMGDAAKNISVFTILDNPGLLHLDIFKYKTKELKKMLQDKGVNVKSSMGNLDFKDYDKTYHGMKLIPTVFSVSLKDEPYLYQCNVMTRVLKTNMVYTMSLLVEDLLAKNVPLKVVAKYGGSSVRHKGYGVSFMYNGRPCRIVTNDDNYSTWWIEIKMYKSDHHVL